jgi:signal transduction histidine kinase/arylsulfatase A-like enzyme
MLDRLWFRLLVAMCLILALAVGTVGWLMKDATKDIFAEYVEDVSSARALRVERVLARQYQRNQSWAGAESVVQLVADLSGQQVVLANSSGQVVADSQNRLVGQWVQPHLFGEPLIITHREQPVGSVYLDPLRPTNRVDNRGQTFLSLVDHYLLWAVAVGILAALILSLLLARWLAAPLEALTRAARRMERGDLSQAIDVRIGGEVGALATAFNKTAQSLARVEGLRKQMVADIAHELRTPLTNIRGYLEGIQDGVVQPNAETLSILEHELAQLTRLVDDLQDLALVESGQLTLTRRATDLRDLVGRELRILRPQAEAHGVRLVEELPAGLPLISADAGRLGQAIRNVLRNALLHTSQAGSITASATKEDGSVLVRIRDTGCGIAPEHLPHIFERFYRGDSARPRHGQGGHGLGLTICRELVQAHGGQVSAESTLGHGSLFTIRLPLRSSHDGLVEDEHVHETLPAIPPAGWFRLVRSGTLLAALFGAIAGLVEIGLLAVSERKPQTFADLFGYAILIDAGAFALVGGLASLVALAVTRVLRRRFDLARLVAIWAPGGFLMVGAMAYLRWKELYNRDDSIGAPQALFAQVAIFGLAAWLALLAGALFAPSRFSNARALLFGKRLAPAALAALVAISSVGIAHDLGRHGFNLGLPAAAATDGGGPSGPLLVSRGGEGLQAPRDDNPAGYAAADAGNPNVLLVTVDSLRADHLGAYGYLKARTQTLDRLAAEGVRFTNAVSNQPDVNAAHASLFTSLYPAKHGLRRQMMDVLPPDTLTMAEYLRDKGYATSGLFSWMSFEPAYSGMERGFQSYLDLTVNLPGYLADRRSSTLAATYQRLKSSLALPGAVDRQSPPADQPREQLDGRADVTTEAAINWLRGHQVASRGQPFFLWVHYFDPHYPYTPPPPFDQLEPDGCSNCLDGGLDTIRRLRSEPRPELGPAQISRLLQYYDGEVAFVDRELGRLLQTVRTLEIEQNTLLILTSDQGQSFGEHERWLNGGSLHDPEVHIPLIMRLPGRLPAGLVVDAVAQQIDVLPTVLELVGLPIPEGVQGRGLARIIRGQDDGIDRYGIAELRDRSAVSVVTRDWRLIKNTVDGSIALYRAVEDPDGLHDLADAEPEIVAELEAVLEQWRAEHP